MKDKDKPTSDEVVDKKAIKKKTAKKLMLNTLVAQIYLKCQIF